MKRYFFHLHEGGMKTSDDEGRVLEDLEAARQTAIYAARAIICEGVNQGQIHLSHFIEVVDCQGTMLFTVAFQEAVAVSGLPPRY